MSTKSRERQPLLGASKTSPPIINGRRVTPDISSNSDSGHVRSQVASDNRDNWTGKRSFECCHGFVLAKVSFSFFLSFFLSFFFLFLSFSLSFVCRTTDLFLSLDFEGVVLKQKAGNLASQKCCC